MDISAAALPPIQPAILPAHQRHPRFSEYQRYRSSMASLLVTACSFDSWLRQREEDESYKEAVFEVDWSNNPERDYYPDRLADGWWKQRFAPGHKLVARHGPFATKAEAEAA